MKNTKKKSTGIPNDIQRRHQITHPNIAFCVECILIITSFILAVSSVILTIDNSNYLGCLSVKTVLAVVCILWVIAIIVKIWGHVSMQLTEKDFNRMRLSEKLSASTLLAQQRANEVKSRSILQITYGHVPEWHPINLTKNVLVYDVHEQLRTILIEMRNAVLALSDQTNSDSDTVTVDLVYCYPDNKYDGRLPVSLEQSDAWRIITSGDMSCTNYRLHDFLSSSESFFFRLDRDNYCFFSDKKNIERYYIRSGKDQEYDGVGSIVGMTINAKNDEPEKVLVKAMLTITTYGWNLCDQDSGVKDEYFESLFKQKVLNGYKSLLESELAQMYIRHMVRNGKMCPLTGIVSKPDDDSKELPQSSVVCLLNPNGEKAECPNKKDMCRCFRPEESSSQQKADDKTISGYTEK